MAVACIALAVALGGTSYAAITLPRNSVGNKQLRSNAVTSSKVRDRSLRAKDFASGQLPRGPRGAQGPSGADGTSQARAAFASRDIGAAPLPLTPVGTYVEMIDLAVPAGSSGYTSSSGLLVTTVASRLVATATLVIVNGNANAPNLTCRLVLVQAAAEAKPMGITPNTVIAPGEYLVVPLTGGIDVDPGSYNVRAQCTGDGPSFTLHRANLTVVATPR